MGLIGTQILLIRHVSQNFCPICGTTDIIFPASGLPAAISVPVPTAQYSTLANFDGSYNRRCMTPAPTHGSPTHPAHGSHTHQHPNSAGMQSLGRQGLPPNAHSSSPNSHRRSSSVQNSPYTSAPTAGPSSKLFPCETCGLSFTRAHDRKRHAQIHTRDPDAGPRCQYCKKRFSREDALKRHLDNGCDDMPDEVYERRRTAH